MSNKFLSAVTFDDGLAQSVTFSNINGDDLPPIAFSGLSDVSVAGVTNASILYYASSDGKWHALPPYEFGQAVLTITGIGQLPSWQSNVLPGDLAFTDSANTFTVGPQTFNAGVNILASADGSMTIGASNQSQRPYIYAYGISSGATTAAAGEIKWGTGTSLFFFQAGGQLDFSSACQVRFSGGVASGTPPDVGMQRYAAGIIGWYDNAAANDVKMVFARKSSTTNNRLVGEIDSTWATSTDATRKGRISLGAHDAATSVGTPREGLRVESSGSAAMVSFFSGGAVVQQTGDVAAALVAYNLLASPTYGTHGRATGQTAAAASVVTVTVGAADGSFMVSANVLITASVTHSFSATCTYTDEGGTSRVLTLNFSQLTGAFVTALTNLLGASAYEGVPVHIRAKAGTTITIDTTGTFTSVTYNVEGHITQIT